MRTASSRNRFADSSVPAEKRIKSRPRMMFLYDLPDWLMALAIVAAILGFALGGFYAFHRFWRPSFTDEQRSVAMTVLTVVATINALLLAFVAVSVWEAFGEAEAAVVNE